MIEISRIIVFIFEALFEETLHFRNMMLRNPHTSCLGFCLIVILPALWRTGRIMLSLLTYRRVV